MNSLQTTCIIAWPRNLRIEAKYPELMSHEEIFGLMRDFRYIVPQGSPMTGIGNNYQVGSLSNCFVIGLDGIPIRMAVSYGLMRNRCS